MAVRYGQVSQHLGSFIYYHDTIKMARLTLMPRPLISGRSTCEATVLFALKWRLCEGVAGLLLMGESMRVLLWCCV